MPDDLVDRHTHLKNYHEGHHHPTTGQCARLFMDDVAVDHPDVRVSGTGPTTSSATCATRSTT